MFKNKVILVVLIAFHFYANLLYMFLCLAEDHAIYLNIMMFILIWLDVRIFMSPYFFPSIVCAWERNLVLSLLVHALWDLLMWNNASLNFFVQSVSFVNITFVSRYGWTFSVSFKFAWTSYCFWVLAFFNFTLCAIVLCF